MHDGSWQGGVTGGWGVLVHGGAGDVAQELRGDRAAGCGAAAEVAAGILAAGGTALDAVQAAVERLEDDARYNAGTGGSLDEDGELRLDASIMAGDTLAAGAVCALPPFAHPIAVARAVLRDGRHVLLAAEGAARFAEQAGFVRATPAEMITEAARRRLEEVRRGAGGAGWAGGTVGAVARDRQGHLAAATSTGGTVNKRAGRVGDSPVVGAGTYADDGLGAASGTGDGEGYLRLGLCLRVCLALADGREPLYTLEEAIAQLGRRTGAQGGVIAVTPDGKLVLTRSTATMSWGARWPGEGGVIVREQGW